MSQITVYTARRIRTMNRSLPIATAVAVRDGQIIEVGSLETLQPWLDAHPHRIDTTFRNHVLMPGFIDPHLHPSLAAILLPCHFITATEWKLPDRVCAPVHGHNAYIDRLKQIEESLTDPSEPLITWGYHKIWHGKVDRQVLNNISSTRPVIVWQRSFHEVIANDAAIDWIGADRAMMERHHQIDLGEGRFYETGLAVAMGGMRKLILDPKRFRHGMELTKRAVHAGGHTTICDMGLPMLNLELEWATLKAVMDTDDTPFRPPVRGARGGTRRRTPQGSRKFRARPQHAKTQHSSSGVSQGRKAIHGRWVFRGAHAGAAARVHRWPRGRVADAAGSIRSIVPALLA